MVHNALPHIIHRQVFDLYLQSHAVEIELTGRLKDAFYSALPRVEAIFSLYDEPDRIIRIDKISLDLGVFTPEKINDLFSSRLCEALSKALKDSIHISKGNKTLKDFSDETIPEKNEPVEWSNSFSNRTFADPVMDKIEYYSEKEAISHAFIYFLANGVFPWWMGEHAGENQETTFSSLMEQPSAPFSETVRRFLAEDNNALTRLLYQFSEPFIEKMLLLFKQEANQEVLHLYEMIKKYHFFRNKQVVRQEAMIYQDNWLSFKILLTNDVTEAVKMLTQHLAQLVRNDNTSVETISCTLKTDPWLAGRQEILEKLSVVVLTANAKQLSETSGFTEVNSNVVYIEKVSKDMLPVEGDKGLVPDEPIDKFLYVSYAGLVILHPFLPQFFSGLGLLDDKKRFMNEGSKIKAVHLLAFLASGEINNSEADLPFCKFLCGMPVNTAIIKNISIHDNEVKACRELLQAVIGHWTALKNTSPGGLREAFLQRKGKLDFREGDPVLFVEGKAHDVLLKKLPWGISFIHLPWIDKPLTTMWN